MLLPRYFVVKCSQLFFSLTSSREGKIPLLSEVSDVAARLLNYFISNLREGAKCAPSLEI